MNDIIKELVKLADKFDSEGKIELAAAVDNTIQSLAARPKAPLKKMDEKLKKDLLKFLGNVCDNLDDSVSSLEELFRRLRYFNIEHEVKGLNLQEILKNLKDLSSDMNSSTKRFYEFSFGKKPSKDYLKDLGKEKEQEQKSEDPFAFAKKPEAQYENMNEEEITDYNLDDDLTDEEMESFWDGNKPEAFEDAAEDGIEDA